MVCTPLQQLTVILIPFVFARILTMKCKLSIILALSAPAIFAQNARTIQYRATMLASNEAQAPNWEATGVVDVLVHTVSDSTGNIVSASVDFTVTYQFPNDATVTGLAIVNAPAGRTGTSVIATDITSAAPIMAAAGNGHIFRQAEVMPGNQGGLVAVNGLLSNPGQYSVNLFTADNPAGAMSGGLQAAGSRVLMASLAASNAAGVATVRVLYAGAPYAITSGEVSMQLSYQFPAQVTFSGMRIYAGQGEGGKLVIPAEIIPGTQSTASGAGVLVLPATQIDMQNSHMVQAVESMLAGPGSFSVDVDTVEYPTGFLSGQLRGTDSMVFPLPNMVGTGVASTIELHTLRYPSGGVLAGTVIFDVNYRLPAGMKATSLTIDGDIPTPALTVNASGFGNVYAAVAVSAGPGLTALNDIVNSPEKHSLEMQTSAGASPISAQLAAPDTAAPVVLAVIPIVEDKTLNTFAPGELVEIYGTNLAKVTTDLSGWPGGSLPKILNNVAVAVDGKFGRLLYVSPNQVDAELAFETPTGSQLLSLNNGNAPSAPVPLNVSAIAPALYKIIFKNADFSLVSPSNPAKAREVLVLYATGMGQTTPILTTGQTIPGGPPFFDTIPVNVTIGGENAPVVYSIAAPPYVAGLYQIAVTVPAGLGSGTLPLVLSAGRATSNTVVIPIQ
jgi:uncharacterized protein (TIGR03437 family)